MRKFGAKFLWFFFFVISIHFLAIVVLAFDQTSTLSPDFDHMEVKAFLDVLEEEKALPLEWIRDYRQILQIDGPCALGAILIDAGLNLHPNFPEFLDKQCIARDSHFFGSAGFILSNEYTQQSLSARGIWVKSRFGTKTFSLTIPTLDEPNKSKGKLRIPFHNSVFELGHIYPNSTIPLLWSRPFYLQSNNLFLFNTSKQGALHLQGLRLAQHANHTDYEMFHSWNLIETKDATTWRNLTQLRITSTAAPIQIEWQGFGLCDERKVSTPTLLGSSLWMRAHDSTLPAFGGVVSYTSTISAQHSEHPGYLLIAKQTQKVFDWTLYQTTKTYRHPLAPSWWTSANTDSIEPWGHGFSEGGWLFAQQQSIYPFSVDFNMRLGWILDSMDMHTEIEGIGIRYQRKNWQIKPQFEREIKNNHLLYNIHTMGELDVSDHSRAQIKLRATWNKNESLWTFPFALKLSSKKLQYPARMEVRSPDLNHPQKPWDVWAATIWNGGLWGQSTCGLSFSLPWELNRLSTYFAWTWSF